MIIYLSLFYFEIYIFFTNINVCTIAAFTTFNLVALGVIGLVAAIVYVQLNPKYQAAAAPAAATANTSADDDLDDELD